MNKLLIQYRWHIRRTLITLGWTTLIAALGLYLYLRITGQLEELVSLRSALPVVSAQRDLAMQNNAMGLRDFKAALQDKQIQAIYIKPICRGI